MKMARFDVFVYDGKIKKSVEMDNVFYDENMSAKEVRDSLINHDGYRADISVYKRNAAGTKYIDMARFTHKDEI